MVKRTKTVIAGGALALALAGTGAGIALAQTTTTPAPAAPSTSAGTGAHAGKHHAGLKKVEHGELTVHTKTGDKVVDVQRGTVTAAAATSVTVKSTDGVSTTYTLGSTTKVHKDKKAATVGDIAVNDRVRLEATKTATTDTTATVTRIGDTGPHK
jgi:hypothetical protein